MRYVGQRCDYGSGRLMAHSLDAAISAGIISDEAAFLRIAQKRHRRAQSTRIS